VNVGVVYYNDYIVTQYQCLKVVSLNPPHDEVYSIQHYVIKYSVTCRMLVVFTG